MHKIDSESPVPLDRLRILLQSVSKMFEYQLEDGRMATGKQLHCLSIKLGIETHLHRNLITLYGRQLNEYRECMRKVMGIIPRGSFYKSLTPMVHSFGYMSPIDALAAFGLIVRLGTPTEASIAGLLVALKYKNLEVSQDWKVKWSGDSVKNLVKHYGIPFVPKIAGGIVEMYACRGLMYSALETLLEMPKIDSLGITSFLNGCVKHNDMSSASTLVKTLEKKGVVYTLNEAMMNTLICMKIGVKFGKNVKIYKKKVGSSGIFL